MQDDLVGKGLNSSVMKNQPQNSIPKADDRFKMQKF